VRELYVRTLKEQRRSSPEEHPEFDAICAEVEDWEPLPTGRPAPAQRHAESGEGDRAAPLDEQILAGLVSP